VVSLSTASHDPVDIPLFESADPFVDLLTETASRNEGQGIKADLGQKAADPWRLGNTQC
jgi:hypothetical protein